MVTQNSNEQNLAEKETFEILKSYGVFDVTPYEANLDFENTHHFRKLELSSAHKMQISALFQQIPTIMATNTMAQAYIVKFPQGLPHTLTALHQGGVGSMIQKNGKFVGSASFYSLLPQATIMQAFTAMSVASGQFFLAQINNQMKMMNEKLEDILGFLYGDKKAELMAEISFVRSTFNNYNSIMAHSEQRIATIAGLQEARKVAIKDIEFYLLDWERTIGDNSKNRKLLTKAEESFKFQNSINLSIQLYVMSNIMEVYVSQNHDIEYLASLRKEMLAYIDKCDKHMLGYLENLKGQFENRAKGLLNEAQKKAGLKSSAEHDTQTQIAKIAEAAESLRNGGESPIQRTILDSLSEPKSEEFYIREDGTIFVKNGLT